MTLIPKDTWPDFSRLFDHAFPSVRPGVGGDAFSPRVDIIEKETAFEVVADLPGVSKDNVSVTTSHGMLTIEASTLHEFDKKEDDKVIHSERYQGTMRRSFSLGDNVALDDIYAEFQDGVLMVVIPKLEHSVEQKNHIRIN